MQFWAMVVNGVLLCYREIGVMEVEDGKNE